MQHLAKVGLILAGICLGSIFSARAQDTPQQKTDTGKVIHIIHADSLNVVTKNGVSLNRFINDVIFRQGNTLFYSDSTFIDKATNVLDAYGHIHINQADSIHIYGDYLHYEGETRLATMRDNARLTDGKVTISGPELQYDMNARIGTYTKGGKLVNGTSVLTSQEGFYYADTKDVYFKKNVLLVDPEYTLTTDTLLYNTISKVATIVAPTTINDGKTIMYTTSGDYNTETGEGNFDSRPTIEDSTATITADRIIMDKRTGMAYAYGNMVYRDTAQKMSLLSNYGTVNQAKKTILATQHPLMILEGKTDTLYLSADTLYSAILGKDSIVVKKPLKDTIPVVLEKPVEKGMPDLAKADSIAKALPDSTAKALADSIHAIVKTDSVAIPLVNNPPFLDTKSDTTGKKFQESLQKANGLVDRERDSLMNITDTAKLAVTNPALSKEVRDSLVKAGPGALQSKPDTAAKDTTEIRYIMAWHNVKIYSDSLQGVADSVYYSTKDSIFRFYRNPVLWANGTQLSGDTIHLYTKNQTADKILLTQNSLIVKEVDKDLYDQIKGNFITGYFKNQTLDWMHVDGNAESIYYVQDDDGSIISVNKTLSGIINMYFQGGQLHHVNFIKDPEGTMYPFGQRPIDQMQLPNFKWDIKRRPKTKYELMGGASEKQPAADTTTVTTTLP
ncbi:OstA-like protein [Chitinophaga sp.]|uniref:OstA-like protein n=1 Tax=Chitinophaga sp. TaxID=1869181 RepID=UPI0031DD2AD2